MIKKLVCLLALVMGPVLALSANNLNVYGEGYAYTPHALWDREGIVLGIGYLEPDDGGAEYGVSFGWATETTYFNTVLATGDDIDSLVGLSFGYNLFQNWEEAENSYSGWFGSVWLAYAAQETDLSPGTLEEKQLAGSLVFGYTTQSVWINVGGKWIDGSADVCLIGCTPLIDDSDIGPFASLGIALGDRAEVFVEWDDETDIISTSTVFGVVFNPSDQTSVQLDYRDLDGDNEFAVGIQFFI